MNESLQQELTKILSKVTSATENATDFAITEAPELIQQILTYNFVFSLICFLTGVVILVGIIIHFLIGSKKDGFLHGEYGFLSPIVIFYIFPIIGSGAFICNLDWLKIWLAPKLYLIEYISKIIN